MVWSRRNNGSGWNGWKPWLVMATVFSSQVVGIIKLQRQAGGQLQLTRFSSVLTANYHLAATSRVAPVAAHRAGNGNCICCSRTSQHPGRIRRWVHVCLALLYERNWLRVVTRICIGASVQDLIIIVVDRKHGVRSSSPSKACQQSAARHSGRRLYDLGTPRAAARLVRCFRTTVPPPRCSVGSALPPLSSARAAASHIKINTEPTPVPTRISGLFCLNSAPTSVGATIHGAQIIDPLAAYRSAAVAGRIAWLVLRGRSWGYRRNFACCRGLCVSFYWAAGSWQ